MKRTFALVQTIIIAALAVFAIINIVDNGVGFHYSGLWGVLNLVAVIAVIVIGILQIIFGVMQKWGGLNLAAGICSVLVILPFVWIAALVLNIIVLVKTKK